jgi:hypothetical protein
MSEGRVYDWSSDSRFVYFQFAGPEHKIGSYIIKDRWKYILDTDRNEIFHLWTEYSSVVFRPQEK